MLEQCSTPMMVSDEGLKEHLHELSCCPICSRSQVRVIGTAPTIHPHSTLRVDLVECRNCLHWFISPTIPQDVLTQLYGKGSEFVVSHGWQPLKQAFSIPERYIIRSESQRPGGPGKYLEVGVGRGLLLNHFKHLGFECHGIEPGPWAQGTPDVVTDLGRLNHRGFDVIVMADVLEHMRDPISVLRQIGDLVEAGTLYACFPNCQSLLARVSRAKWRMVRPFGHLHFFSRPSFSTMLEASGFTVKRVLKTNLTEACLGRFFASVRASPARLLSLFTQRFCGDQWIVHAEKRI